MTSSKLLLLAALAASTLSLATLADEGVARVGEGVKDAVTAPAAIPEQIGEDASKTNPVAGTVTGTAKGAVKAAGQVVKGAAEVGVGAVEAVTAPITGGSDK